MILYRITANFRRQDWTAVAKDVRQGLQAITREKP